MFWCWTLSRLRRSSELNSCWKLIKFLVPDESVKHWVKERYLTVDWIVRDSFKKCSHNWILIALISSAFQFFEATSFHRRLLISDWRILRYSQPSNESRLKRLWTNQWPGWIWASVWCQLSLKQTVSVNSSCFILIGLWPDGFLCYCQTQTSGFIPEWPHDAADTPEEQVHDGKPRDGYTQSSFKFCMKSW